MLRFGLVLSFFSLALSLYAYDEFSLPRPGGVNEVTKLVDKTIQDHREMVREVEQKRADWFSERALGGHKIEVIPRGYDLLRKRLETIVAAKRSIFLSSFIYGYEADDWSARKIGGALCMMARKGVEVRLLLDGFGGKKFYHNYADTLRECGIAVLLYNPTHWGIHKIHYVIHEKFLIVDGEVVMMGGNGIADPYHEIKGAKKHYHDLDIRIWGPAACHYHRVFMDTWYRSIRKARDRGPFAHRSEQMEYWMWKDPSLINCEPVEFGDANVLPLYANPFFQKEKPLFEHYRMASLASKKEILLYAPYFVPHNGMIRVLSRAMKRGVKIKVITNSIESNDEGFLTLVGMGFKAKQLWKEGLEIYLFNGPKTLHRKGGLFDNKWVYFGSDNQDARGHFYQSESVAFSDDIKTVKRFRELFEEDLTNSAPLTKAYLKRIMKGAGKTKKWLIKRLLKQL